MSVTNNKNIMGVFGGMEGYMKGPSDEFLKLSEVYKEGGFIYYAFGDYFSTTKENMTGILKLRIVSMTDKNVSGAFTNSQTRTSNEVVELEVVEIKGTRWKLCEKWEPGTIVKSNAYDVFNRADALKFKEEDFVAFSPEIKAEISKIEKEVSEILDLKEGETQIKKT